jgi:glycine oxidase
MSNPDCIIVGGGAIGLMSAHFLTRAGMRVELFEQGELARESTWAGGGIVSPMYPWRYDDAVNRLAAYGQKHYPAFLRQLHEETGVDVQLLPSGMLMLDAPEPAMWDWAQRWSAQIEHLDSRSALEDIQPGLADEFDRGLWMPQINQLRNPRLAKALAAGARQTAHLKIVTHTPVEEVLLEGDRVVGIRAGGQVVRSERVLVTAGAWSGNLMPEACQSPVDVYPVKGQMILFAADPSLLRRMVMLNSRYLIPRKDGLIVAGSTLEFEDYNKQTTSEAMSDLRRSAVELVPALEKIPVVHQWAGLRPGSAEGIPFIGECPAVEGLYVNAGQFRNGIVMGLGSALLGAQLMMGEPPFIDPAPYRLS